MSRNSYTSDWGDTLFGQNLMFSKKKKLAQSQAVLENSRPRRQLFSSRHLQQWTAGGSFTKTEAFTMESGKMEKPKDVESAQVPKGKPN